MRTNPRTFTLFCAALLIAAALIVPATAETVTLTFQDIGLTTQQIDIYDASGAYLTTTNTSSVATLNVSESNRYTIQLKPQAATADPVALLDALVSWLTAHILIVVLLLVLLLALGGLVRRR